MKRMMTVLLLAVLALLSGCNDKVEVEENAYVVAMGLDLGEKEGEFEVSFQIINPEVGSMMGGESPGEAARETITVKTSDFVAATNTASASLSRELTLDHTEVLIVSEELARSGNFINIIQAATRSPEIRGSVEVVVSQEKAGTFLRENTPPMETRPHTFFRFMITRAKEIGTAPDASLHRFFQITEGDADLFLAHYATTKKKQEKNNSTEDEFVAGEVPQKSGNNTEFMGSAVFKEGTMIDTLTGDETKLAVKFDNTMGSNDILSTYPDPRNDTYRITTRFIQKENANIDITLNGDKPADIQVTVPFEIEILAIPSLVNYVNNEKYLAELSQFIEEENNRHAEALIKKTQEEYGSEPFYWSLYVRKFFGTIKEYEEADWNKKIYPNANIKVNFNLENVRFGKLIRSSDLDAIRD